MEFATEYRRKEKVARLTLFTLCGAALLIGQHWLSPYLIHFVEKPHCYQILGLNGADYFWQLLFVALPAFFFVLSCLFALPVGIKGIKEKQFPPKSTKVFRPTRVRKGAIAYLQSGILVVLPIITLFVAVWGYSFATTIPKLDREKRDEEACTVSREIMARHSILH